MLLSITMRHGLLSLVLVFAAVGGACSDEKPTFGNAGGVLGRRLPGEVGGSAPAPAGSNGFFPGPYDANANPPKPTTTLKAGHAGGGKIPIDGADPKATSQCLDCHKTGGAASGKPWSFGGRVLNAGGTAGEADADVIVVNADGKVVGLVKTDAEGFFWAAPGTDALANGAQTIVRNAKGEMKMSTKLNPDNAGANDGGCDRTGACHNGGTPGSIRAK